jgi:thiosulfate reductase cytochrome b subunit
MAALANSQPVLVTDAWAPRHTALVRVTHWLTAACIFVLVLSGIAILLAHPRLYWGETGGVGGPSLVDLPLPFVLEIPIRGPGRYLHFLAAWVFVALGLMYAGVGVVRGHFGAALLPARAQLTATAMGNTLRRHLRFDLRTEADFSSYNVMQRLAYSTVVFVLSPLAVWTGLGMSPTATSVVPFLATTFGGQQSARTMHFVVACLIVLFAIAHIVMVSATGFSRRMRDMTWPTRARGGRSEAS